MTVRPRHSCKSVSPLPLCRHHQLCFLKPPGSGLCFHSKTFHKVAHSGDQLVRKFIFWVGDNEKSDDYSEAQPPHLSRKSILLTSILIHVAELPTVVVSTWRRCRCRRRSRRLRYSVCVSWPPPLSIPSYSHSSIADWTRRRRRWHCLRSASQRSAKPLCLLFFGRDAEKAEEDADLSDELDSPSSRGRSKRVAALIADRVRRTQDVEAANIEKVICALVLAEGGSV
jgi:hypothetical protein